MTFWKIKLSPKKKLAVIVFAIITTFSLYKVMRSMAEDDILEINSNDNGYIYGTEQIEFKHPRFTREKLGHQSWELLHLITAFVPEKLSSRETKEINSFLKLFGKYYPCKECGSHFLNMVREKPFEGNSRSDFMKYLCERHNQVNKRLKKNIFPCKLVEEAWGQVGCGCDPEELVKKNKGLKDSN